MKKELEGNETEVNVDEEKTEQEPEKETVEEVKEPEEVKEEPKEEPKEEVKQEEKPDAAAFARMRRELAAAKKEAEELKNKMSSKEETVDYDAKVSHDLEEILRERQIAKATQEFVILEENFKSTVPDYEDISNVS